MVYEGKIFTVDEFRQDSGGGEEPTMWFNDGSPGQRWWLFPVSQRDKYEIVARFKLVIEEDPW